MDLVEESPMKATNYTPKAGPIRKLLKGEILLKKLVFTFLSETDDRLNSSALNSTADLLSPRDGQSLLFGASSEASSSDDEVISSRSAVTERMSPAKFSFTSPIRAGASFTYFHTFNFLLRKRERASFAFEAFTPPKINNRRRPLTVEQKRRSFEQNVRQPKNWPIGRPKSWSSSWCSGIKNSCR